MRHGRGRHRLFSSICRQIERQRQSYSFIQIHAYIPTYRAPSNSILRERKSEKERVCVGMSKACKNRRYEFVCERTSFFLSHDHEFDFQRRHLTGGDAKKDFLFFLSLRIIMLRHQSLSLSICLHVCPSLYLESMCRQPILNLSTYLS